MCDTILGMPHVFFPIQFLREVLQELRAVSWPSRKETVRSTLLVIGISTIVGLYIATLDLGFTKAFEIVLALKK